MKSRRAAAPALAVKHIDSSSPPQFELTRADAKSLPPAAIPSPYEFPVEGHPNSNLMRELAWYLESFLDYPFPPETIHAEHVLDALTAWGAQAFNALFDRRDAGDWLADSDILQIRSDNAQILSWPWEALYDPESGAFLAHQRRIERQLNQLPDPPPVRKLPKDRVNILLVVARPYENDVRYRSLARPLVELIHSQNLPAHVDVLRPPTFDQLRDHLRAHPSYYHVLHFDGHGAFGDGSGEYSPHQYQGPKGCLVFETAEGDLDEKSTSDLTALLHEYAVPAVVLNACQSAMLDQQAEDAFSTVATALLRSGMRSVVAMSYSLYVSGAQIFLPAFYRRLFESGNIADSVRAGRQQMLSNKLRTSARGPYPLHDWLLPVLYQQAPLDFDFVARAKLETRESRLPKEIQKIRELYGFIGRDSAILNLERALHRETPGILIQGLGGVGKTTLARGFLRWLDETGGLDAALWFDFRDIRSAEFVLNETGELFYGETFRLASNKLNLLADAFRKQRVISVWDNFESAASNLTDEDRASLAGFLDAIRATRGKVIITSRSSEDWLDSSLRCVLPLGGLDREERWEYCDTILRELNLKIDRNDPDLVALMDQLAGHPLAMRVVLSKLERMPAAQISEALRTNLAALGLSEKEEQGRLFATLRFVEQGLPEDLRPMLPLAGLHESYLSAGLFELMSKQVDPSWTRPQIDRLITALSNAGLLRGVGNSIYQMHPLLTSYLCTQSLAPESCQRAFVDIIGILADQLTPRPLHEQRIPFLLHGANFHFALELAERLGMHEDFAALTQSLAAFAQNSRNYAEASRLYLQRAHHKAALGDPAGEASAYHQLGIIAQEQRDFDTARDWHFKSLAIKEQQGDLPATAKTYHQLGRVAQEQRDFDSARDWYLKSLAIKEEQNHLPGAAITYHQLGMLAQQQGDFDAAREWYLKSLAIEEQLNNAHGAARTYHQLGMIAQEQRDFDTARDWYLKSLAIEEHLGNFQGAAITYHQLGIVARKQGDFDTAREWYLKSLAIEEAAKKLPRCRHHVRFARRSGSIAKQLRRKRPLVPPSHHRSAPNSRSALRQPNHQKLPPHPPPRPSRRQTQTGSPLERGQLRPLPARKPR
jgi:tetratricopeptide (TPR) repeat protein